MGGGGGGGVMKTCRKKFLVSGVVGRITVYKTRMQNISHQRVAVASLEQKTGAWVVNHS